MLPVIFIKEDLKFLLLDARPFLKAVSPRLMKTLRNAIVLPIKSFPNEEEAFQIVDPLPDFHQLFGGEFISGHSRYGFGKFVKAKEPRTQPLCHKAADPQSISDGAKILRTNRRIGFPFIGIWIGGDGSTDDLFRRFRGEIHLLHRETTPEVAASSP